MKIKSKFKDYYDHVAHIYGGGDPKVTYVRDRICPLQDCGIESQIISTLPSICGMPYDAGRKVSNFVEFKTLVVCGKEYLLVGYRPELGGFTKFHLLNKLTDQKLITALSEKRSFFCENIRNNYDDWVGVPSENLIKLSKFIGHPVFIIDMIVRGNETYIDARIPVLAELGFAAIMPPEQLYQELAYFVANVMIDSPDIKPPAEVSDTDKIQQHGFDKKVSFRHRV